MTWSNTLKVAIKNNNVDLVKDSIKIVVASLGLVIASQIAFPLPFSPVPISMQTVAIFLIGITLGPVRGALAVAVFLFEGAIGLPVFSLGRGGLAVLLGARGGYLVGFAAAAFLSGWLANKNSSFIRLSAAFLAANAAIYAIGLPWLSLWIGSESALTLGFYPFIIGDVLKIFASAAFVKGLSKIN